MPTKILILLTDVLRNGGIQRFNRTLLTAFQELGESHDVISIADDDSELRRLASAPTASFRGCAGHRVKFAIAAARAILSGRYHTVIVGHIHLAGIAAMFCLMHFLLRPRLLLIAHGTEIWRGVRRFDRLMLRTFQKVLCVSRYTSDQLRERVPHLAESQTSIFPNAIGEDWIRRQAKSARVTNMNLPSNFILSVARLTQHDRTKGIRSVIEAMSGIDERIHYVIAGGGDDIAYLQGLTGRFGVERRVHFVGTVSDEALAELYSNCIAFVLPSSQEGFGIVFLEAMYFGAPVIASADKGAMDVVRNEETGLLVRYGDTAAITAAVNRVLDEPGLAARLRDAGRALVTEGGEFTFQAFKARTAGVIGPTRRADLCEHVKTV